MVSNHNLSHSNTSFVRMFRSVPFAVGPRKSPSSPNLVTDLDYSAPISDKKVDLYVVSTGSGAEIVEIAHHFLCCTLVRYGLFKMIQARYRCRSVPIKASQIWGDPLVVQWITGQIASDHGGS